MVRRIPPRLMPHWVWVQPCTGQAPAGPLYGPELAPVRAGWAPSRQATTVTLDGATQAVTGQVFMDDEPPLRSLVRVSAAPGRLFQVVATTPWDHPDIATYAQVQLADAPAGAGA